MERYAKIQIIGKRKGEIQKAIEVAVIEVCQSDFDYNVKSFVQAFYHYDYTHGINDNLVLIGVKIHFLEDYFDNDQSKRYLQRVLEIIRDNENVEHIVLFYNSILFLTTNPALDEEYIMLYKEISKTESKIREIVSIIFNTTYPEQYYELLREHEVNTQNSFEMSAVHQNFENEFFHLLFCNYPNLAELRREKLEEFKLSILDKIRRAVSFEELQEKLETPIFEREIFSNFLSSIKSIIDPIEKARNCIMHGRRISDRLHDNYQNANEELQEKIANFFTKMKARCPECSSEMFIQDGKRGKFLSCSKWRDVKNSCKGSITI